MLFNWNIKSNSRSNARVSFSFWVWPWWFLWFFVSVARSNARAAFRFKIDRVDFCEFSILMHGQTRAPRFVLSLTVTILVNCHFIARSKSSAAFWFDFWPWRFWWIFVFNERSNPIQFEKRKNRVTWIRICGFDFKNQDGQTQNEMKLARLTVSWNWKTSWKR